MYESVSGLSVPFLGSMIVLGGTNLKSGDFNMKMCLLVKFKKL